MRPYPSLQATGKRGRVDLPAFVCCYDGSAPLPFMPSQRQGRFKKRSRGAAVMGAFSDVFAKPKNFGGNNEDEGDSKNYACSRARWWVRTCGIHSQGLGVS